MKAEQLVKGKRYYSLGYHRIVFFEREKFMEWAGERIHTFVFTDICDAICEVKAKNLEHDIVEYRSGMTVEELYASK